MANWKGLLAGVLNAYDLTSFVTVSTKENLLQNRDFAHFFFFKCVLSICQSIFSLKAKNFLRGEAEGALEK